MSDRSRYLDLFVQEAREHLESMGQGLVALERAPEPGRLDELFRNAHSVKGMASSMGFDPIATLSHRLEDLMDAARDGRLRLEAETIDLSLAVVDHLLLLVEEAAQSKTVRGHEATAALLAQITALLARATEGEAPAPDPEPTPSAPETPASTPQPRADEAPLLPEGTPLLEIRASVDPDSKVPGVRAFIVYKRLSEHGEIVRCQPSLEEIKAGRLHEGGITVVLATEAGEGTLARALSNIAEVEGVEIRPHHPDPAPGAPSGPAQAPPREPAHGRGTTVRVRTGLLDDLMDSAGELLLAFHHLGSLVPVAEDGAPTPLHDAIDRLGKVVRTINRQVVEARMTPIALLFDRLPRVVRDVARKVGREVEITIEGTEIELDRAILDELDAPLTHLVRNAVDHGIEPPQVRHERGKPARGQIRVRAWRDRDRVMVEVQDDGGGLDPEALREKALATGRVRPEALARMSPREVLMLATLPGLSTRETVSSVSGRGVGLDVVRDTVEGLGGSLEIDSAPGRGTRFVLHLPLTIAIQRLLLVTAERQTFALPVNKILHVTEIPAEAWSRAHGSPVVPFLDRLIPVVDLRRWLGEPHPIEGIRPHVVVEDEGGDPVSVAVDQVTGHLEALIKPLDPPLDRITGLSGVAFLPEGRPIFVLDLASVARSAEHASWGGKPV